MKRITQFILCLVLAVSGYGQSVGGNSVPRTVSGISNALDLISSTQGTVFYRGASGWEALTPGTSGQLLSTQGAAANPIWVTATGGAGDFNGPASATDNAIVRFDGTGGKTGQNSAVTIADTTGSISINGTDTATAVNTGGFKSANFGLSTVSGGASYFGGNVTSATQYTISGAGAVPTASTIAIGTNGAGTRMVLNVPTGGEINLNVNGALVTAVSGTSGLYTTGLIQSTNTTASIGLGTGALQVAGGIYAGAASVFAGLVSVGGSTPASAGAAGVAGTITWDASYIYICTATNTWKRVAIATW